MSNNKERLNMSKVAPNLGPLETRFREIGAEILARYLNETERPLPDHMKGVYEARVGSFINQACDAIRNYDEHKSQPLNAVRNLASVLYENRRHNRISKPRFADQLLFLNALFEDIPADVRAEAASKLQEDRFFWGNRKLAGQIQILDAIAPTLPDDQVFTTAQPFFEKYKWPNNYDILSQLHPFAVRIMGLVEPDLRGSALVYFMGSLLLHNRYNASWLFAHGFDKVPPEHRARTLDAIYAAEDPFADKPRVDPWSPRDSHLIAASSIPRLPSGERRSAYERLLQTIVIENHEQKGLSDLTRCLQGMADQLIISFYKVSHPDGTVELRPANERMKQVLGESSQSGVTIKPAQKEILPALLFYLLDEIPEDEKSIMTGTYSVRNTNGTAIVVIPKGACDGRYPRRDMIMNAGGTYDYNEKQWLNDVLISFRLTDRERRNFLQVDGFSYQNMTPDTFFEIYGYDFVQPHHLAAALQTLFCDDAKMAKLSGEVRHNLFSAHSHLGAMVRSAQHFDARLG